MGSILADIVDEIDVKPNKTKLILKWVIGISGSLIATAFLLGQLRTKHINRLDRIETNQLEMKVENRKGFSDVNVRIDKVSDDYHKDMLELMLEINRINFESKIEKAKNENVTPLVRELP